MKKIKKHFQILQRRIRQKSELEKIRNTENTTLQSVLNAIEKVKNKNHTVTDTLSFSKCETFRRKLLSDDTPITYEVFQSDQTIFVKDLCNVAASGEKWCQLLYHLVKNVENPSVLEIGTNLGVSGSYILEGVMMQNGRFITMEGVPQLCEIATHQFSKIASNAHFEVIQGLYDDTFPQILKKDHVFNVFFIDGNHRKKPTLYYFNELKKCINSVAIFIFDDIYWNEEMKETWDIIKMDQDVNFIIDLYKLGIVIVDQNETIHNQHFHLHLTY
ncbi:MAG TPA: class I SAM-dependent methyltransferase [Saprospiraceae bacterium]|nr:class I SAM-dependent methyltransferase [Saprospiraceae bacterium]